MKIRLSFTTLNLWERGLKEDAINSYFKIKKEPTEAIVEGKAIDELITEKINQENKLPSFMGKFILKKPIPQLKLETDYDKFRLVGVLDCYDEGVIYEFKTGNIPSNVYALGKQIAFYSFLAEKNNYKVNKIFIIRYDQIKNKTDATLIWHSQSLIDKAIQFIEKNGNEIYQYLFSFGLI